MTKELNPLRDLIAEVAADLSGANPVWTAGCLADALIARGVGIAGWQPITTAPMDGTIIDVWRDGTRETVFWGFPPHCCGEMGSYCDSDWHSLKNPGWICSTFGEYVGGKHDPFTHWMPVPAGPAEGSK